MILQVLSHATFFDGFPPGNLAIYKIWGPAPSWASLLVAGGWWLGWLDPWPETMTGCPVVQNQWTESILMTGPCSVGCDLNVRSMLQPPSQNREKLLSPRRSKLFQEMAMRVPANRKGSCADHGFCNMALVIRELRRLIQHRGKWLILIYWRY